MSLSADAIKEIGDLTAAATAMPSTYTPTVALPRDVEIHSLEKYQPNRARFRGFMHTESQPDFIDWVSAQHDNNVFIDAHHMRAVAIHNMGTANDPGHCDHRTVLTMLKTAPYNALLNINGDGLSQQSLAMFAEDHTDYVSGTDASGEELSANELATRIRSITIENTKTRSSEVGDFSANMSDMERIEAQSNADKPLPAYLRFTCMPYHGLAPRDIYCRIILGEDGRGKIRLSISIQRIEQVNEEIADEFKQLIKGNLNDTPCYIGEFHPNPR